MQEDRNVGYEKKRSLFPEGLSVIVCKDRTPMHSKRLITAKPYKTSIT